MKKDLGVECCLQTAHPSEWARLTVEVYEEQETQLCQFAKEHGINPETIHEAVITCRSNKNMGCKIGIRQPDISGTPEELSKE